MRIRDINVLSLNELTNTKDSRIRAIHVPGSDRWALRIQETRVDDSGGYECQVTTANKTIEIIQLNVLGNWSTVRRYIQSCSTTHPLCCTHQV